MVALIRDTSESFIIIYTGVQFSAVAIAILFSVRGVLRKNKLLGVKGKGGS